MRSKWIATFLAVLSALGAWAQNDIIQRQDTLDEVVVVSQSARQRIDEVQIGVEKISVTTLAKVPALFGEKDIIKSIQLLPGVKSESEASGGYQVRGGTSSQNLILLDGATIYNAGHLMGLFSTFNDDALGNASLYKGLQPAAFGGATSSVFDIDTRVGDNQQRHFSGTIGLLSAKIMAEGPIKKGQSSYLVTARRSYLDLFLKTTNKYRNNTLNFYDLNLRFNFRLSPKDILALSLFRGRDNMGVEEVMDMKWDNTTATLSWAHDFNDKLRANTQGVFSNFHNETGVEFLRQAYDMTGYIRHFTLRHRLVWTPTQRHTIDYGVESTYLQVQSAEWDVNALHQRERRYAWMNGFWASDNVDIVPGRWLLSMGLRLDLFSVLGGSPYYQLDDQGDIIQTTHPKSGSVVKTYVALEPRFSMKWTINQQNTVKIGYSRTSQHIHAIRNSSMSMPFDRFTMSSNILKPQLADQVAVGWMGMTERGDYDFSAEAYFKSIRNVYDYRDGKSFSSEIEIERLLLGGKGRAYGLELCAHKNTGRLTGWASYTLSWSENKIEGINGGEWYTASNDRRHDIAIVALYQLSSQWELSATWRYNTGQALTAPSAKYEIDGTTWYYFAERNGYRAPAYHRLDIGATYTKELSRATRIWTFGLYNAYGRYNPFTIHFEDDDKKTSGSKAVLTALFGIVPSVSFTLKF